MFEIHVGEPHIKNDNEMAKETVHKIDLIKIRNVRVIRLNHGDNENTGYNGHSVFGKETVTCVNKSVVHVFLFVVLIHTTVNRKGTKVIMIDLPIVFYTSFLTPSHYDV